MKAFLGALMLWTAVSLALLYFDVGYQRAVLGCMRAVGRSAACEDGQEIVDEAWWWLHGLPMIISISAGYIAIALVRVRAVTKRDRTSPP